jgi:FlaA1/EpsC-like NDP-sugar epimerase
MEANPVASVQNNVFGTKNLIDAAAEAGTGRLVLVSTDKVTAPANVYGASKSLAEALVLYAASAGPRRTEGMVVRFGNVLGSRGSILPLFRRQIEKGGPLTITDPRATRFFMTIPEAVSLVLQAAGVGTAGELYVLDMGEPIGIRDLAEQMIRFYGYEPGKDIEIAEIGLRPGEKLSERLFDEGETPEDRPSERIVRVRRNGSRRSSGARTRDELNRTIEELRPICFFDQTRAAEYRNRWRLREVLRPLFPELQQLDGEPEY